MERKSDGANVDSVNKSVIKNLNIENMGGKP